MIPFVNLIIPLTDDFLRDMSLADHAKFDQHELPIIVRDAFNPNIVASITPDRIAFLFHSHEGLSQPLHAMGYYPELTTDEARKEAVAVSAGVHVMNKIFELVDLWYNFTKPGNFDMDVMLNVIAEPFESEILGRIEIPRIVESMRRYILASKVDGARVKSCLINFFTVAHLWGHLESDWYGNLLDEIRSCPV